MRTRWFESIRLKMIRAFVLSLALAGAGDVALLWVAANVSHKFGSFLRPLYNTFGVAPFLIMVGLVQFVIAFFLLTRGTIRYIEELDRAINQIAEGDLDIAVPIRTADELGHLANNLGRMSAQLRASLEDERRAERSKQELITNISHDLRTPLTSMLGYLDLVESDRYRDEVELRHYVSVAYNKCRQLQRMIDQLFEFTRTGNGGLRLQAQTIDLGQLLRQLAEEFVPALDAAGMAYHLAIPPQRIQATVDPDLIVRVFENLIANAIRHGLTATRVDLEVQRDGNDLVVRIANDGEPIPERALPHLFDSFYRAEASRSEQTGGAGLGLAIARNIVQLHGGSIAAFNEPGRTVFEVRLPAPAAGT